MASKILFIFEGQKTENKYINILANHILNKDMVITCAYATDIYNLFQVIDEDPDLDIFTLLKDKEWNKKSLAKYCREDFGEIYLFFDYDGHASLAKNEHKEEKIVTGDSKIEQLLELFDNETDNGKLYISYPMVEAFRHMEDYESFKYLLAKCKGKNCEFIAQCDHAEECLKEPHYKETADKNSIKEVKSLGSNKPETIKLIKAHLCKMNYIVNDVYDFPDQLIEQPVIFDAQQNKYISLNCPKVAVLSAFPAFIHDYYGNAETKRRLENKEVEEK